MKNKKKLIKTSCACLILCVSVICCCNCQMTKTQTKTQEEMTQTTPFQTYKNMSDGTGEIKTLPHKNVTDQEDKTNPKATDDIQQDLPDPLPPKPPKRPHKHFCKPKEDKTEEQNN